MKARLVKLIASLLCVAPLVALSAEPAWWKERGVIPQNSDQQSQETISNNYSPANLGQLKFFAKQAAAEMNAKLTGGAGTEINNLIQNFSVYTASDPNANYAPLNIGQLKAIAKAFYTRLAEVSTQVTYPAGMVLIAEGKYPWTPMPTNPTAEDYKTSYAPANLGQLKFLFAWSISGQPEPEPFPDVNNNRIDDRWEISNFGHLVDDPNSNFSGDGITIFDAFYLGLNPNINNENPNTAGSASKGIGYDNNSMLINISDTSITRDNEGNTTNFTTSE